MINIPVDSNDVTKEFMQSVLSLQGDDVTVTEVEAGPAANKGDHFSADLIRATAKGTRNNVPFDESYIIKLSSTDGSRGNNILENPWFLTEIEAYSKLFPEIMKLSEGKLSLPVPRCILSTIHEVASITMLEDLKPAGYKLANFLNGHSVDECKAALTAYATLHALGYKLKFNTTEPIEKLYPQLCFDSWEDSRTKFDTLIEAGIKVTAAMIDKIPKYKHKSKPLEDKIKGLGIVVTSFKPNYEKMATICHGDCNSNNILFKYDKNNKTATDTILVDFELLQLALPLLDISNYLYSSTTPQLRKEHLKSLLQYYHKQLMNKLKVLNVTEIENWDFETLWKEYKDYYVERGLYMSMIFIPLLIAIHENVLDLYGGGDAFGNFTKVFEQLANMDIESLDFIKTRITGAVEEMIEYNFI